MKLIPGQVQSWYSLFRSSKLDLSESWHIKSARSRAKDALQAPNRKKATVTKLKVAK